MTFFDADCLCDTKLNLRDSAKELKLICCPARNKRCRKCNKMGHFEVVCKTRMLKEVRTEAVADSEDD